MSDDIDIEEHDVLDNPHIRNMLPYITSIKTEVEDYEDEDTSIDIEEDYHTYNNRVPFVFEEEINIKPFNNKIIIGSKPCVSTSKTQGTVLQGTSFQGTGLKETSLEEANNDRHTILEETVTSETNLLLQERTFLNKIILGSKTQSSDNSEDSYSDDSNSGEEGFELPEVSVVLEDCNQFLEGNPCFCEECGTLFATDNDMDAHKMISHSFLVAVSKNKALKSTSKSHANSDCKTLLCNHCNTVFPNTLALLRHTYELLPGKFSCDKCDLLFDSDSACKAHSLEHHTHETNVSGPLGTFILCKICTCHFKWTGKLRAHMRKHHHTNNVGDVKYVKSNFQCYFCRSKLSNSKRYNIHILMYHSKLYNGSYADFEKTSKFRCPKCNLCLSSDYSVRIHLAAKHGYLGDMQDSKKLANLNKNPVELENLTSPLKLSAILQQSETQNIRKSRPIPKSTLYKCNKCHIHFLSCISAVLHSKSCVVTQKKGNYKCQQCRRQFTLQDKFYHDYQHRISGRFKVFEITRNILNRIICKCKSCHICFDEKSFMTFHTDSCNGDTPSVQCKECNVWIHEKAMGVHKKIHTSGLTVKDFIITEYVHASIASKEQEETDLIDNYKRKPFKVIKVKRLLDKMSYFYCPSCKCYLRMNKYTDKHYIGQCIISEKNSTTCKSCGLRFTKKTFKNHIKIHKMHPKLKLKDLKFINIQTGKRIVPPFPNFKKCNKCKVAFYSADALNNHACNSEESKICKYCKGKFSDLAYKLHIAFHEYAEKVVIHEGEETNDDMNTINENIPELMKKYKSLKQVWNILYLCQACDIIIDTYDKVVEHCQDHFCNMQSYNVTIEHCDICDLNFVDDCFKRHEKLHLNDDMNKDSFIILEYKYENLLSESWMNMFRSLAKEQIQLILSKSMYKFTRCARMKVVSNGSLDLTLYQCAKCLLIVAPDKVMEHSQNVNNSCENTKQRYRCVYCTLRFVFKSHKIVHEKLHEIRKLDSKSFRIIQFHADKQFSVTELKNEIEVGKKKDPGGLKFIRCQHCGKLINKTKYKGHIKHHIYYKNCKNKGKNTKQNIQQQKTQPRNPNKILNFYVCRECKVCVAKDNIKTHICDFNGSKSKCVKCSLVFRSQNLASHYKSHEKNNFNRSNMQVMYFDGEVIDKKPAKRLCETKRFDTKLVTVYQCSQCTLCIWVKCNLSRHVCSPPLCRYTCKICGLTFLTSRRKAHEEMHNVKSFNRKNVHLIKFNNRTANKPKSTSPVSHKPKVSSRHEEINRRNVEKRKLLTICEEDTVAKKPRMDNVQLGGDFVAQPHNKYFKCKTCKLLFLTLTSLIEHEFSCKTDRYAAKCDQCGLVFHASMINHHKTLVNCKMFTKNSVYILTIKQISKNFNTPNNWIYQCINCDSISFRGLRYHLDANHKVKMAIQTCEQCNIKFTSNSYAFHLKMQHGKVESDISELSIGAVEDTTLVEALKDLPNDNQVIYGDNPNKQTADIISTSSKYPCDVCGLNFIKPASLLKHKYIGRHKEKQFTCGVCDLKFTQRSLNKHMEIYHKNHKIDNNDAERINTNINDGVLDSIFDENQSQSTIDRVEEETDIDVLNIGLVDNKNDEGIDHSVTPSFNDKSTNNVSHSSSSAKTDGTVPGIYNCNVCNMSFVHPTSLRRHKQADKHNEAQHTCKECGLIFSLVSLKKHVEIHHNIYRKKYIKRKPKIDINDSIVKSVSRMFDNNQPNTSSIEEKMNTKNITSINNTYTLSETVTKNVNNELSATEENNIETNNAEASQSIENNYNKTNENNAVRTEELNKNKLFKCSICNVYFLTADDCREHTENHIQLDTFEYIACKVCDLQFCCEFLGRHMRSHREKTFSLDDLIVAEYHPNNDGEVKIDTYLFVKTKLVSTTTHFDTEIVDSTTENLVESQSVAINDASESTPCTEADTGSET